MFNCLPCNPGGENYTMVRCILLPDGGKTFVSIVFITHVIKEQDIDSSLNTFWCKYV